MGRLSDRNLLRLHTLDMVDLCCCIQAPSHPLRETPLWCQASCASALSIHAHEKDWCLLTCMGGDRVWTVCLGNTCKSYHCIVVVSDTAAVASVKPGTGLLRSALLRESASRAPEGLGSMSEDSNSRPCWMRGC